MGEEGAFSSSISPTSGKAVTSKEQDRLRPVSLSLTVCCLREVHPGGSWGATRTGWGLRVEGEAGGLVQGRGLRSWAARAARHSSEE